MPTRMIRHFLMLALVQLMPPITLAVAGESDDDGSVTRGREARSLLQEYCFACHGDGASEGGLALDQVSDSVNSEMDPELWWKVRKNLRAGVMPPAGEPRPSDEEAKAITDWIKFEAFGIDPANTDPGRLPIRRLNRVEYGNTVNDLMGVRFNAALLFPADDSGHGFDNVGDALSISPLLMEKYFKAARMVVAEAVPRQTWIVPLQRFRGDDFSNAQGKSGSGSFDAKQEHDLTRPVVVEASGRYRLDVDVQLDGSFDFDPARYQVDFVVDDETLFSHEYGWDENRLVQFHYDMDWEAGEHSLQFRLRPIAVETHEPEPSDDPTSVRFEIKEIRVEGPEGTKQLVHPPNYERFFTRTEPPQESSERSEYAAEVLRRFTRRAFRGGLSEETVSSLVRIAEAIEAQPGETFESGIARAMVAALCSPRFLFHLEGIEGTEPIPVATFGPVSEIALASRLSYLLWSTMPDDELLELAESGQLRQQLSSQLRRMLDDDRSEQFLENFVGQWLRTRDVTQTSVDPLAVLGLKEEFDALLEDFRRARSVRGTGRERTPEEEDIRSRFRKFREIGDRFDADLRRAMQQETEMCVEYIVREDRTLLELIDSDYTFLNESLARHYGVPDVDGDEMRRVTLPEGSPRGGVLTQASMLLVTSNPTRTSPVKRGLFVLENVLGTPAPPAPGGVPELEESAERFEGRTPTLRELLAVHREAPICSSCHARMDPLGLALENFNALGEWRDSDAGQPIDASGELITGERFADIRELKKIIRAGHASEFYRCVTEKLLTYAIGRGIEYGDEHAVDLIVEELEQGGGRFSVLLEGIVRSSPFQNQRYPAPSGQESASE